MLRTAATLLCLAVLSAPAEAGDHRMIVTGQITFTIPTPLPGPIGGVFTVGAPFEVVAEVADAPIVVGVNHYQYPLDTTTGGMTVNGVSYPFVQLFGEIMIFNDSTAGSDGVILASQITTPSVLMSCGISFSDPTFASLSSPDIADLDGVSLVADPSQVINIIGGMQNVSGSQFLQVLLDVTEMRFEAVGPGGQSLGTPFCTANPNSTGNPGECRAFGSNDASANDVTIVASELPLNVFGFFLVSATQDFVAMPGGSQGNLCLGGAIGRYVGSGQIMNSGFDRAFSLQIDLTAIPQPNGPVAVQAGETWNFTAWHRDSVGGAPASNFTDGVAVSFL
ncbi:MAG: hypothetical protein AAF726_23545 [Planctomycetota bacterium]